MSSSSSSLSPSSSPRTVTRVPLLPSTARPRPSIKLLSLKKRPQSVVSLSPPRKTSPREDGSDGGHGHAYHHHQQQQKRSKVKSVVDVDLDRNLPVWILGDSISCLVSLPLFHVSPMTHLVLKSNDSGTSPNRIASRIVQCIRSMDAKCDYNSKLACATIQTRDQVVLLVQLLKTQDSKNIIVEVERKRGDIIQFHSVATTILNALRNPMTNTETETGEHAHEDNVVLYTGGNTDNVLEHGNRHQVQGHEDGQAPTAVTQSTIIPDESNVQKFEEAMDRICTLLRKDRMDAVVLGMESLSLLTDGKSSNEEITYQAVKAVLQNDSGEWQVATDKLLEYLGSSNLDEQHGNALLFTALIVEGDGKKTALSNYDERIKHLALRIVSNCFAFMMNKHSKDMLMILADKNLDPRLKDVLLLLVEQIQFDDNHGNDTFQAVRHSLLKFCDFGN